MKLKKYIPLPVRRVVRSLRRAVRYSFRPSALDPAEVVKANTKEAFEFFWNHDDFIDQYFMNRDRLAFFELVADYCVGILMDTDFVRTVRIADIGCGSGHMLEVLRRKLVSKCNVELFGLDFASAAISKARTLLPMATFVVADLYENGLPSDSFDLVLCIETLEHLRLPQRALLQLLRICKAGGDVVITVPNAEKDSWDGHVNFWNASQFSELLSPYGLVDIKLLQFVQDDMIIMARLAK